MEQTYDYGLKFITVKNAGHRVPLDNPKVAKILLDNFIEFVKKGVKPKPQPEPEPTSTSNPNPENKEEDSFPVWAIIVISVGAFLIIVAIVFIIIIKRRKKISIEEIEEEGGKLMAEMAEKEN